MKYHKNDAKTLIEETYNSLERGQKIFCKDCGKICDLKLNDYSFSHLFGNEHDWRVESSCCEGKWEIKGED